MTTAQQLTCWVSLALGTLGLGRSMPAWAAPRATVRPALAPSAATDDTTFVRQAHRRPVFQFDQRFSLLQGKLVGINGLKAGVEWRGRWRAGLGVYLLSGGVPTRGGVPAALPAATRDELRFRYVSAYGEYVLIGNPRWELSVPLQLGVGNFYSKYYLPDGSVQRSPKELIYMVEPTAMSHFRVFRWIGLGAGAGYRQMVFVNDQLEDQLSGVIFTGRVKLFLGDLYKVVRGRQRLFSQRGLRREDWGK
ncbi:hypothetical protein [Hymenobacter weizhouensis]|uniref:hypothetical protein n=1 Tax=Hymenobacter sp. YIM 151500-1 TaxID=2987689 RepID=UPI002226F8BF|nr:hypothetical protein [Hymenobacter sp. YIM 151500-1]UYZ63532.1 hypothetical protein OIS53_01510 [Hymenobacter sp. YIM 151500-1]